MNTLCVRTRIERDLETRRPYLMTKVLVDGQVLVAYEQLWLGVDIGELRKSMSSDGDFYIVTCSCGEPRCAGIREGIRVYRDTRNVHWVVRGFGATRALVFDREAYATAIEQGIQELRHMIDPHQLDVVPASNTYLLGRMT